MYFQEKIKEATTKVTLNGVYVKHSNPHFGPYFDASRPYNRFKTVVSRHEYIENHVMPFSTFIDFVEGDKSSSNDDVLPNRHHYYYLSKEIDQIDQRLIDDIYPYHELLRLNPQKTSINCWIGQSGVVTPCHYDGYHNIYVQLSGYKMFYLLPPNARDFVKPFPFLHPSQAQCQNENYMFEQERVVQDNDHGGTIHNNGTPVIALLKPGDVLYIPPLWFHSVVAVSPSYSVNAWTEDVDVVHVNKIFHTKLPSILRNNKELSEQEKVVNVMVIIYKVIHQLLGMKKLSTFTFFKRISERRYNELLEKQELPNVKVDGSDGSWPSSICKNLDDYQILRSNEVQHYINKVTKMFEASNISKILLDTWLSNYVEFTFINSLGIKYLKMIPRIIAVDMVTCSKDNMQL
eukprot:g6766.t1